MEDSAKYLIHADVAADGIVERTDVVGAVFGQTEGLIGEELDIRDLQESSKLGRIDVAIDSEGGRSYGQITIGSNLDRVETAILAAALETVERVGPCRASISVRRIEDVRAAKRRSIVERAQQLLAEGFDEGALTGAELVEEVRQALSVEDVTTYRDVPAGPNVADGDAIILVEGRADVDTLLDYGIKNAIAVEGTDIPEPVATLTRERTTTAFLDGDRGGDLILRELLQRGDVDYIARAPEDTAVEDLEREAVMTALREKEPVGVAADSVESEPAPEPVTDGSVAPKPAPDQPAESPASLDPPTVDPDPDLHDETEPATPDAESDGEPSPDAPATPVDESDATSTLREHAAAILAGTGLVRLVDAEGQLIAEGPSDALVDLVEGAESAPTFLVLDAPVSQAVVDVAAQHGIDHVVGRERGAFTKQPAAVRIRTAADLGIGGQDASE